MSVVRCHQSISLDGYTAGPNQSLENPIGQGGMSLHGWMFETAAWRRMQGMPPIPETPDSAIVEEIASPSNAGAYVMGRHMFDPNRGEWDESWKGWWGDNPPYHAPVFVLTHFPREPLHMQGGTTFFFVTDGIESALRKAREAAGDKDVHIAGGANTVRQTLRAGQLDELYLHIVPIVLGAGERLLDGVGALQFTPMTVVASPGVTHIKYRVDRQAASQNQSRVVLMPLEDASQTGRTSVSTTQDAEEMGGVGLGRLWDTHPKVAFVLHVLLTVYFGVLAVGLFLSGNTGGGVVLTIGFAVMAGSLVLFTLLADQSHWQPDDTSYEGRGQVVNPREAWTNTQPRGRILWVLFGVAFPSALVLLLAKSAVGVALILAAFVLAIIAMRTD